jgi:hypothetical protein
MSVKHVHEDESRMLVLLQGGRTSSNSCGEALAANASSHDLSLVEPTWQMMRIQFQDGREQDVEHCISHT